MKISTSNLYIYPSLHCDQKVKRNRYIVTKKLRQLQKVAATSKILLQITLKLKSVHQTFKPDPFKIKFWLDSGLAVFLFTGSAPVLVQQILFFRVRVRLTPWFKLLHALIKISQSATNDRFFKTQPLYQKQDFFILI